MPDETHRPTTVGSSMSAAATIREQLRDAVVAATAREPAKVLAFRLRITDEGARKIQTGQVLPRPEHLLMLAREFPNIHAVWMRCMHPEGAE